MNKKISLKFECNNKILELNSESLYKIISIEGIESSDYEINIFNNLQNDGGTVENKRIKPRPIVITGDSSAKKDSDEHSNLIGFFNPHYTGKVTINYCGNEKTIGYEVESFIAKTENINKPIEFILHIICPDPFWKEIEEESKDLVTWISNLEFKEEGFSTEQNENYWIETENSSEGFEEFQSEFGTGEGIEFGYRFLNQIVEIDNIGDVKTPIRIVFRADADVVKPYIQDMNSYELIRVNKTLKAGDVLEIITEYGNKNIYLNRQKAHQYLDFLNSTWLQLNPGINLIKYGAESGINNLECRVFYTPKYLGV